MVRIKQDPSILFDHGRRTYLLHSNGSHLVKFKLSRHFAQVRSPFIAKESGYLKRILKRSHHTAAFTIEYALLIVCPIGIGQSQPQLWIVRR
jgi:hypothetical protein